jgi:hypothetical protein
MIASYRRHHQIPAHKRERGRVAELHSLTLYNLSTVRKNKRATDCVHRASTGRSLAILRSAMRSADSLRLPKSEYQSVAPFFDSGPPLESFESRDTPPGITRRPFPKSACQLSAETSAETSVERGFSAWPQRQALRYRLPRRHHRVTIGLWLTIRYVRDLNVPSDSFQANSGHFVKMNQRASTFALLGSQDSALLFGNRRSLRGPVTTLLLPSASVVCG